MSNSKIFYTAHHLLKKVSKNTQKLILTTWSRESTVIPIFLDHTISIYNGKQHFPVYITKSFCLQEEIFLKNFHKFGEFNNSRFFKSHKFVENKIKKKLK